jgi:acyl transferase domain-containing protein
MRARPMHIGLVCYLRSYCQDGRSSTLTAPNGPSQQAVMRAGRSDISHTGGAVLWIAALQMHGTGTPLGDPIEVGAAGAYPRPLLSST